MLAPNLTQTDFLHALQALMPHGKAWPTDSTATLTAVLNGLVGVYATQNESANGLLIDSFPATAVGLLTEWQSTLAQPDPAGPTPSSTAQAQQFAVAKFTLTGGQSVAAVVAFGAAYGITITVDPRAPFRAGQSRAGHQCGTTDLFNGWYIHLPTADAAYTGLFTEIAAAHTVLNFILT